MSNLSEQITKKQLNAFYQKVGETIAEWLGTLECPNCKLKSDLDWVFKKYSDGKPQLICRHCLTRYPIHKLRFKRETIEPMVESLSKSEAKSYLS